MTLPPFRGITKVWPADEGNQTEGKFCDEKYVDNNISSTGGSQSAGSAAACALVPGCLICICCLSECAKRHGAQRADHYNTMGRDHGLCHCRLIVCDSSRLRPDPARHSNQQVYWQARTASVVRRRQQRLLPH